VTVFAVAGVANSINIIDGFNGLASMCCVLILLCLAYVGFQVDDLLVAWLALAGVGAVLGFFVWNFPAGLIFLGDGGAYFMGFYLAEVAILLLHRNPTVSPMFPLLLCIYPVFETVFLHLPQALPARHAAEHARRHPPAFADLQASHALGGGQPQRQGADAAQLDDFALPVAALHVRGHSVGAVLGQHRRPGGADRGLRRQLRGAVLAHRALQVASLAGVQALSRGVPAHGG
jgi:hypothetical protein